MFCMDLSDFIGTTVFSLLNKMLESMAQEKNPPFLSALTKDLHILPDFHGNRYALHSNLWP